MSEAFAWIGQLVDWLGRFVPRWVILPTTTSGVKFVRGSKVVPINPGIHWFWPATTILQTHPTTRQTNDLRTQTLVTTDGKTVGVGGMVSYRVDDVVALLSKTWDADQTIRDICAGAISEIVRTASWPDLQTLEFERELRMTMRKRLRPFGVRVMKATLTDCTPIKVIKVVQATSADVG